jgi:hypothetical protein
MSTNRSKQLRDCDDADLSSRVTPRLSRRLRSSALAAVACACVVGGLSTAGAPGSPKPARAATTTLSGPPIAAGTICNYVNTWLAPRSGGRQHQGVDIIAKSGTPLLAVADGTIAKINPDYPGSSAGNHVNIKVAGGTTYFVYLHLLSFAEGLAVGNVVKTGDVIGYVGSTGSSSTPHLHFEVHPNGGAAVDPTGIVLAAGTCGSGGSNNPSGTPPTPTTPTPTTVKPPSTTKPPTTTTRPPNASATAGATRIRPTGPATTGPKPPVAPPGSATTVAPPAATNPPANTTTPPPATTAAPTVPTAPPPSLGVDVLLTGIKPAMEEVAAQVVGAPGLRGSASVVDMTVTISSYASGRGVVWPCGSPGNLEVGTPVAINVGETVVRVSVAPGAWGQICFMSDVEAAYRVTIDNYR